MFWKPNKISTKINLVVFFIITLFMFINGFYSYYDYKNKEIKRIKSDLETLLQRLSKNCANPLWNYNSNTLREIVNIEMGYNYVDGIIIKENEKFILSMIKDKDRDYEIVEISDNNKIIEFIKSNNQQKDIPIIYDNKEIAQIIVVITDRFIDRELFFMMIKIIIQTIVLAGLIIILLSISTSKIIAKPIKKIVKVANSIANGDMSINELEVKAKDELGILMTSFNKMLHSLKYKMSIIQKIAEGAGDFTIEVELASEKDIFGKTIAKMLNSLNDILGKVNSTVDQVSSGSNQFVQASSSLSQGATDQASSLEQITSSVVEISSQAKRNADNAIEANNLSKSAMENANKGNQQMKELIAAMADINKSSSMIKNIVKVIDDIAFQTNLLALNANVEAARAGKFGKGFTVVAEEVRNLASRSAKNVQETTYMVEESIKNIDNGNKIVDMTAEQLDAIMEGAQKAAVLVEEIACASKEQTLGLEQINQGLEHIDQVTQKNTATAEKSAIAAKELANRARQLKTVVASFKLTDNNIVKELDKVRITKGKVENINHVTNL